MATEKSSSKTLVEQIVEETLTSIKKHNNFDEESVQKLKKLYESGNIKRVEQIIKAIKPRSEVES